VLLSLEIECLPSECVPELNEIGVFISSQDVGSLALWVAETQSEVRLNVISTLALINVIEVVAQKYRVLFYVSSSKV
jgi:hypothetical protein